MVCHELVIQSQNNTMIIYNSQGDSEKVRIFPIFAFEAVQLTRGSCFIGIYYIVVFIIIVVGAKL